MEFDTIIVNIVVIKRRKLYCGTKFIELAIPFKAMEERSFNSISKIQCPKNNYFFFWKMFKKKLQNIFSNFFFYLKVQNTNFPVNNGK